MYFGIRCDPWCHRRVRVLFKTSESVQGDASLWSWTWADPCCLHQAQWRRWVWRAKVICPRRFRPGHSDTNTSWSENICELIVLMRGNQASRLATQEYSNAFGNKGCASFAKSWHYGKADFGRVCDPVHECTTNGLKSKDLFDDGSAGKFSGWFPTASLLPAVLTRTVLPTGLLAWFSRRVD